MVPNSEVGYNTVPYPGINPTQPTVNIYWLIFLCSKKSGPGTLIRRYFQSPSSLVFPVSLYSISLVRITICTTAPASADVADSLPRRRRRTVPSPLAKRSQEAFPPPLVSYAKHSHRTSPPHSPTTRCPDSQPESQTSDPAVSNPSHRPATTQACTSPA